MSDSATRERWNIILAFTLLYIFWGSTYLFIDIAVTQVPPALMAGTRFLIAGPLMLVYCAWRGMRVRISRHEAIRLAAVGILLLTTSNVVLAWAEQWVPSGLAALMVSVTPIWFLVLETWIFPSKNRVTGRLLLGIFLGIFGIAVLLWPDLRTTGSIHGQELFAALMLILSSLSWALGSVLSNRWNLKVDPFTATGWEMMFAGIVNVAIGLFFGEQHRAIWSFRGLGSIIYLVIFGSWVGFTAYIWLLKHVPTPKVATYAYVNPVVAVFLGWLVLSEKVTLYIFVGTAIVVAAVALVTGSELKHDKPEKLAAVPAVETGD